MNAVQQAIMVHGTDGQRARVLDGADVYCLGFSEPEHGSDLAGIETRGDVVGGEIIINGQKAWVSGADEANAIAVLCRTDSEAPRHHDLSYVLVPLDDNGIEIRPVQQMSGAIGFFQIVLDGARAPLSNVIGGLGNGWRVAMTTLGFERGGRDTVHLESEREYWALVETARRYGRDVDPLVRQELAWAYSQVRILRFVLSDPEPALERLLWSEYHRRFGELAIDITGADALVRPEGESYATSRWQHVFLSSRADTISSGTSEIQRSVIAERVLGLPR
jgi:alkylation response protein AidB-like acyl-CoA dehydrogenase